MLTMKPEATFANLVYERIWLSGIRRGKEVQAGTGLLIFKMQLSGTGYKWPDSSGWRQPYFAHTHNANGLLCSHLNIQSIQHSGISAKLQQKQFSRHHCCTKNWQYRKLEKKDMTSNFGPLWPNPRWSTNANLNRHSSKWKHLRLAWSKPSFLTHTLRAGTACLLFCEGIQTWWHLQASSSGSVLQLPSWGQAKKSLLKSWLWNGNTHLHWKAFCQHKTASINKKDLGSNFHSAMEDPWGTINQSLSLSLIEPKRWFAGKLDAVFKGITTQKCMKDSKPDSVAAL